MPKLVRLAVPPLLSCCLAAVSAHQALAQAPGDGRATYTCTSPDGRKLTADRPIPECTSREQRVLNSDGSLRAILPPYLSPEERAAKEAQDRKDAVARAAQQDAIRRDRNLMLRFPTEKAHQRAREEALDVAISAMRISELRIADLAKERKPLEDEAQFYVGKPLPGKLKQQMDANDAAVEAQKQLIENQKAELVRVNGLYDKELARLKKLWAGAPPGSLGAADGKP